MSSNFPIGEANVRPKLPLTKRECILCGYIWNPIKDGAKHTDCIGHLKFTIKTLELALEAQDARIKRLSSL